MEMKEKRIASRNSIEAYKLFLNDRDDYIYINDQDAALFDRFAEFINWIGEKTAELQKQEREFAEKYGDEIVKKDENGNVEEINAPALLEISKMRTQTYRDTANKIDSIFGEGTIKKFFYVSYDINPNFVPDDECIFDFLEEITPVLNDLFADRKKRIDLKYGKNRNGGKGNKYRSKTQLINEYKG